MNARHLAFTSLILLGMPCSDAQTATPDLSKDPVQAAIRQFNANRAGKQNEVSVVLDPVGSPPAPLAKEAQPEPATPAPPDKPTAPQPSAASHGQPSTPASAPPNVLPAGAAPTPRQGLAVRVEKLQVGSGTIDPAQVKLLAPFPAKPLTPAPAGWSLQSSPTAPPFTREVELSPGNKITLTVHPHVLVPDADGAEVFTVPEPGFDAALGYRQNATVGAILAHSIRQLDDDSKELGTTIDKLQQILVSLPKPPPLAQPVPDPQPTPALQPTPTSQR